MHKVITGTAFAIAALATTAAFAADANTATSQPTALERIWTDLTASGTSTRNAAKSADYSASDRVRLNGYAPTGKPHLDAWVRDLRRFRTDGPAGG